MISEYGRALVNQIRRYKIIKNYYDNMLGMIIIPESKVTEEVNKEILDLLKEEAMVYKGEKYVWSLTSQQNNNKTKETEWVLKQISMYD